MQPPPPTWFDSALVSNIINGLANGVAGALAGGIIGFLIAQRQQRRKIIEYSVSAISLANIQSQAGNILRIMVDRKTIEEVVPSPPPKPEPKKDTKSQEIIKDEEGRVIGVIGAVNTISIPLPYVTVASAYAFEVQVKNIGNEDIEKPTVEIMLDETAKIVTFETNPKSRPDYELVPTRINPNTVNIGIPYMNKGQMFTISLVSVDNSNRQCNVTVRGLGVQSRSADEGRRSKLTKLGIAMSMIAFIVLLSLVTLISLNFFSMDTTSIYIAIIAGILGTFATIITTLFDLRRQENSTKESS